MIEGLTYRQARKEDIPFVIEAIIESEKSGSDKISSCNIFELTEESYIDILKEILIQDIENYDYYLSGFLIAELGGENIGALGSWMEDPDDNPSGMIKASVLFQYLDKSKMKSVSSNTRIVKGLALTREKNTLQLEHGYVIEKYRRRGVFTGLLKESILFNFEKYGGFEKVQGILFKDNYKSYKALLKFGYEVIKEKTVDDPGILKIFSYNSKVLMELNKEKISKLLR